MLGNCSALTRAGGELGAAPFEACLATGTSSTSLGVFFCPLLMTPCTIKEGCCVLPAAAPSKRAAPSASPARCSSAASLLADSVAFPSCAWSSSTAVVAEAPLSGCRHWPICPRPSIGSGRAPAGAAALRLAHGVAVGSTGRAAAASRAGQGTCRRDVIDSVRCHLCRLCPLTAKLRAAPAAQGPSASWHRTIPSGRQSR